VKLILASIPREAFDGRGPNSSLGSMDLSLDLRPYEIATVLGGKDEAHQNANQGLCHWTVGPLQGSRQLLLSDCPWALPTARLPSPFQVALEFEPVRSLARIFERPGSSFHNTAKSIIEQVESAAPARNPRCR